MPTYPEPPPIPIIPIPEESPRQGRVKRTLFIIAAVVAGLYGLGLVALAFTVGNCAAFGGSCGDDPPLLLDDDVFGMAFAGVLLITAGPAIALWRRNRQIWLLPVSLCAAALVALMARTSGY